MEEYKPKQTGELVANEIVNFFDNITDENGQRLVKSAKRSRLLFLMKKLYDDKENNVCVLDDGTKVPILVKRQEKGRAAFVYMNTADVEPHIIFREFAKRCGITYKETVCDRRNDGELPVHQVKHLFDDVKVNGQKTSGLIKQQTLHKLFKNLAENPQENIVSTADGNIPIVVKRKGENNFDVYCLNAVKYRAEVFKAFAKWAGCVYLSSKENEVDPPAKNTGELTVRECTHIFHNVEGKSVQYKYSSERIQEWFSYIENHTELNKVTIPNGSEEPLIIYRKSHSQKCLCLNTADESIKPFVIKRTAEIMGADVCFDNLTFNQDDAKNLHRAIVLLDKEAHRTPILKDEMFYRQYAQRAFMALSPKTKKCSVNDWLTEQNQGR